MRITKNYNGTNETIIGHDIIDELTVFERFDFETNFCIESIEVVLNWVILNVHFVNSKRGKCSVLQPEKAIHKNQRNQPHKFMFHLF